MCRVERHGFRKAGEVGEWEFKPKILHEQSAYRKSAIQKDDPADKEYYGTLYQDNKTYDGLTFISLTLWVILRDRDNIFVPRRSLLFTDAPYNAEYVREINSPYKCDRCGKEYIKKELCEHNDKFLCDNCLVKTMDRDYRIYCIKEFLKRFAKQKKTI